MLTIKWEWTCDACGLKRVEEIDRLAMFRTVELFQLPTDWNYIAGQMICPNHSINVTQWPKPKSIQLS